MTIVYLKNIFFSKKKTLASISPKKKRQPKIKGESGDGKVDDFENKYGYEEPWENSRDNDDDRPIWPHWNINKMSMVTICLEITKVSSQNIFKILTNLRTESI